MPTITGIEGYILWQLYTADFYYATPCAIGATRGDLRGFNSLNYYNPLRLL